MLHSPRQGWSCRLFDWLIQIKIRGGALTCTQMGKSCTELWAMHCGFTWPVGISNVFQRPLTNICSYDCARRPIKSLCLLFIHNLPFGPICIKMNSYLWLINAEWSRLGIPQRPSVNKLRSTQMYAISQTTFSIAFAWMKMFEFRLKFHWSLSLRFQLTTFQHWLW